LYRIQVKNSCIRTCKRATIHKSVSTALKQKGDLAMRKLLYGCFIFLGGCAASWAQLADTTSIVGNVTDASSAQIAQAKVTAVNSASNDTYTTTTNADGFYTFQFVRIGTYNITVQKDGFQLITRKGVTVDANQTVRADFSLAVGKVSEHVEVTASNPPISTDNASVKEIIGQQSIAELPLNGRDTLQLAITTPGVIQGLKGTNGTPPGEDFIGAGSREIENSVTLDGISIVNNLITTTNFHPSADSIQEFEVQTGTYTAQYGAYLGAHLNLITKTGTNGLHGAAWEFLRNDDLDARPYFLSHTAPKTPLHQNQFGFEVAGPIIIPKLYDGRNKTFFMADYEGLRDISSSTSLATTFTPLMETGNFSQLSTQLLYPGTKTPIPGNIIPASLLSPQAQNLLKWFPVANQPGVTNNLSAVYPNNDHFNETIDRLDQNIGDKMRFFFRYALENEAILAGAANPYQATTTPVSTANWVVGYTQTFSPTMVNDVRLGRQNLDTNSVNYWYVNNLKSAGTQIGIPGFTADTTNNSPGIPAISISNYLGTGSGGTNWFQTDTTWHGTDSFTWTHGTHTVIAGAELQKLITGRIAVNNTLGLFNFSGQFTGSAAADFILGVSNSDTTPAPEVRNIVAEWRDGFFVTDNWRVRKNLTIDIGLRYELPTVPYTKNGYATILNAAQTALIPANPPQPGFGLTSPNHKDFAPRLGIAYRVTDKTVVRLGYGIYYNPNQTNSFTFLSSNPPFAFSTSYSSNTPVVTLANPEPSGLGSSPSSTPSIISPAYHMPTAYMNQWSGGIQQALWSSAALEIGYVGSHTVHLDRSYYNNTPLPGPGAIQARRPNQLFGSIRIINNDEDSSYNGLSVTFRQRFAHGITALASYTWAHDLDVTTDSNGGGSPMNPYNWREDYGNSNWDIRHRFVGSFTYDMPFLKGSANPLIRTVVAGWQANGIIIAQSGLPFNVTIPSDQANVGLGSQRPNLIAAPSSNCGDAHLVNCISLAAYQLPALYTWGSEGRNLLVGPGLANVDFSMFKNFAVKELMKIQFRAEFFNLFNHPDFSNPNTGLPSLTSGNYTYAGVSPGSFGSITSTSHNNRQIQLALKVIF